MKLRQKSFGGGEVAPVLYGRTDLKSYFTSLRTCHNWLITKHGAAMNRAGTRFVREVKDSTKKVRLIPFVVSELPNEAYVLEFGAGYIRFYANGGIVLNGGVPYEVPGGTPYTEAQLPYLSYAQQGDVLTITHPDHAPRELRRSGHTSWALSTVDFTVPSTPLNITLATMPVIEYDSTSGLGGAFKPWEWYLTALCESLDGKSTWETAPYKITNSLDNKELAWDVGTTYGFGTRANFSGITWVSIQGGNVGHTPTISPTWWSPAGYMVSGAYGSGGIDLDHLKPVIRFTPPTGLSYRVISWELYRGVGTPGWLASFDAGAGPFYLQDDGTLGPNYAEEPPRGENPFAVKDATGALVRTENPAVTGFSDQRRVFADLGYGGLIYRPDTVLLSRVSDYANFDRYDVLQDDDRVNLTLASRQREAIRWVFDADRLLVGTNAAVWALSGADGGLLAPSSLSAKRQASVGSSWLPPLEVGGGSILYVRVKGTGVRELAYDDNRIGGARYASLDASLLAPHLFEGCSVVDWAYQEDPWSIVWQARSDGALLGLTHLREQEVVAWHRHTTDGTFENVCSIPEGDEDAVYLVVQRSINGAAKRYVERFVSRRVPRLPDGTLDTAQAVMLDASLSRSGAPTTAVSGLDHLEGCTVMALADGNVCGPYTVTAGAVDLSDAMPDGASVIHVGLPYVSELESLDLADASTDIRTQLKSITEVHFEVADTRGLRVGTAYAGTIEWRQRQVTDSYGSVKPFTGIVTMRPPSGFDLGGRLVVRQEDPLPVTLLSLGAEVDLGD